MLVEYYLRVYLTVIEPKDPGQVVTFCRLMGFNLSDREIASLISSLQII